MDVTQIIFVAGWATLSIVTVVLTRKMGKGAEELSRDIERREKDGDVPMPRLGGDGMHEEGASYRNGEEHGTIRDNRDGQGG